jgi:hypothetical protein
MNRKFSECARSDSVDKMTRLPLKWSAQVAKVRSCAQDAGDSNKANEYDPVLVIGRSDRRPHVLLERMIPMAPVSLVLSVV